MTATIRHLDHLNMTVADLDATTDWYARVFGFERVEGGDLDRDGAHRWAILRAGDAMLCLYERTARPFVDNRESSQQGLSHFALRIADRAAWEATLERERLPTLYGSPVRYDHSVSWYVADPTGYEIEVVLWDDDTVRFDVA